MKSIASNLLLFFLCFTSVFAQTHELPSLEKEWTANDIKILSTYLKKIPEDSYPTVQHENALFQKIIAVNYKRTMRDKAIDIDVKMPYIFEYQQALKEILMQYLTAHKNGNAYGMELSHISGIMLAISAEIIPVLKEFMKTLDPNDKNYQVRMNGLKQMKFGLKQQLQGTLIMIKDTKTSSNEERIVSATYLLNSGVEPLQFLDASDQEQIKTEIETYIPKAPNKTLKKLLHAFLKKL
ncbi:hypothetical protein KORDIASMS9_00010 [Kordia sp. SMS9]|uniref:hypothetical protein n=1 Tax=Kordia sp. SMS9 TaxID=2282170 RepID=UPI000E1034F1|nr:hypothetical protein [Kordia sp. SMS9]AXG67828.1 hypothetical protein KORDIASMS9_00010 [Kordia sp. SMS9]